MLLFVARILGKMDARLIVRVGMTALIGSMVLFSSRLTLTMPDEAYLAPLILRGVGTGLQLVPLSVVALGTLPPNQVTEGAGLFNLFRQVGGSFGIARLTTLLDRRGHLHCARLAEGLYAGNSATSLRLAGLCAALTRGGVAPGEAPRVAAAVLERAISRQADLLAFRDLFFGLLVMCSATLALLAPCQRPRRGGAAGGRTLKAARLKLAYSPD